MPRDPSPPVDAAVVAPIPDAPPAVHIVLPTTKPPKIEAPHGGTITTIAVTPDGTGAITIDDLGGMRLWPALDGTIEPRVTELPRPSRLAIGPDPRGFVVSMIDEAGGAVIQLVDRDGAMLQRATLPLEPGYSGIAMTDRGTLAWRTDQRIVRISSDGTITATLATDPGQRVLGIGVAAAKGIDHAVAVIEGETDSVTWKKARWLSIGDKLAWGAWIPAGSDVGGTVALSPSGKRIAWLAGVKPVFTVTSFDTVRNVPIGSEAAPNATSIEMIDDDTVVTSGLSGTVLVDLLTKTNRRSIPTRAFGEIAAGGGNVFSPNGGEIVFVGRATTTYLGYGLQSPAIATPAPGGRMLIGGGDMTVLLDAQLQSSPLDLVPTGQTLSSVVHLTGTEWLVATHKHPGSIVAIVDPAQKTRADLRTMAVNMSLLVNYEPKSQLIGISQAEVPEILRYVPGKQRADAVGALPKSPTQLDRVQLWPVATASGGTQVVTAQNRDRLTLRWAPDPRALDKGPTVTVDGSVAAVDPTGRVFVWQVANPQQLELATYRDGKRLGTFALGDATGPLWPEPNGDRLLVTGPKIVMFAADGSRTWTRAFKGVGAAVWLDDGAIGIVTALGIARLDAKTGEPTHLKCGWGFGLSLKSRAAQVRAEPLCTQPR